MVKISLGLRNHKHQVELLKPNGESRTVLGSSEPGEENRRLTVLKQWGGTSSPRQQALENIDVPLPQRSQTILSHRLNAAARARLNGGAEPLADSRKHNQKNSTEILDNIPPNIEPNE